MVHMQQSKVLQARMEGFSEKWHIRNVSEINHEYYRKSESDDF